jgi:hypothetical protein
MEPDLDSAPHCERDDDPENCGIEITPEMIEAGKRELLEFSRDFESEESAVRRIYFAMREIAIENYRES